MGPVLSPAFLLALPALTRCWPRVEPRRCRFSIELPPALRRAVVGCRGRAFASMRRPPQAAPPVVFSGEGPGGHGGRKISLPRHRKPRVEGVTMTTN
jgi:hypothetical protein